jgi:hypothetical protein
LPIKLNDKVHEIIFVSPSELKVLKWIAVTETVTKDDGAKFIKNSHNNVLTEWNSWCIL